MIEFHISYFLFAIMPLLLATGFIIEYLIAFFSIFIHELGHIATASARGCRTRVIKLLPAGVSAVIEDGTCSRKDFIIICLSGPAVNILLSVVFQVISLISAHQSNFLHYFVLSNIYLAAFNMIPAIPLDGGKILNEILSERMGLISAGKYLRKLAFILSAFLIMFGIYQMIYGRMNFSILIIGLYIMFTFKTGKMEASLMNIKQMVYRRSRIMKKGIYPARDLVAMKSANLSETIKNMDFDSFHFVHVLDDNFKVICVFSENEIMEYMLKADADLTFEELINKCSISFQK